MHTKPTQNATRKFKITVGALGVLITTASLGDNGGERKLDIEPTMKATSSAMTNFLTELEASGRLNVGDITVMAGCGSTGGYCGPA